jgi:hypothetical protein
MIVARLVVITSASVLTVHNQHWNCHLRIKADVVEKTSIPSILSNDIGLLDN